MKIRINKIVFSAQDGTPIIIADRIGSSVEVVSKLSKSMVDRVFEEYDVLELMEKTTCMDSKDYYTELEEYLKSLLYTPVEGSEGTTNKKQEGQNVSSTASSSEFDEWIETTTKNVADTILEIIDIFGEKIPPREGGIGVSTKNSDLPEEKPTDDVKPKAKEEKKQVEVEKVEEDVFADILDEMWELYKLKNAMYGSSFDQTLDEDGLLVSKIRMTDKLNRFSTLAKYGLSKADDESIEDTLIDLANYAVLTVKWLRSRK